MRARCCALLVECAAEFVGTFLLVFLGCASTAGSVLTAIARSNTDKSWEYESAATAAVWGIALAVATVIASPISGAHLNPAVTVSLAISRSSPFQKRKVPAYVTAQLAGSMLASLAVLLAYDSSIKHAEASGGSSSVTFERGSASCTVTAMVFTNYFPNPIAVKGGVLDEHDVSAVAAIFLEAFGTLLFVLLARTLSVEGVRVRGPQVYVAFSLGCCLSTLMVALGPLIQVSLNPARDLGPRVVAFSAGWSSVTFSGPGSGFWAYLCGPLVGGVVATLLFDFGLQHVRLPEPEQRREPHASDLERSILTGRDKVVTLGVGPLTIDPGKGLHHSDFRDSPTPHGHSYRMSSPATMTQAYLRQQLDLA